jgi:hypothetical protein
MLDRNINSNILNQNQPTNTISKTEVFKCNMKGITVEIKQSMNSQNQIEKIMTITYPEYIEELYALYTQISETTVNIKIKNLDNSYTSEHEDIYTNEFNIKSLLSNQFSISYIAQYTIPQLLDDQDRNNRMDICAKYLHDIKVNNPPEEYLHDIKINNPHENIQKTQKYISDENLIYLCIFCAAISLMILPSCLSITYEEDTQQELEPNFISKTYKYQYTIPIDPDTFINLI